MATQDAVRDYMTANPQVTRIERLNFTFTGGVLFNPSERPPCPYKNTCNALFPILARLRLLSFHKLNMIYTPYRK